MSTSSADIEDVGAQPRTPKYDAASLRQLVRDLHALPSSAYPTKEEFQKVLSVACRKAKVMPSKRAVGLAYKAYLTSDPMLKPNPHLQRMLIHKAVRSNSGILNISVSLPPDKFSCKYDCFFCPNEPGMPRSYLSNEDVFRRAARVGFNTAQQVYDRLDVLEKNGHPIDKLEFRVLGGTFSCYDHAVADTFVRDLYYAANTYYEGRDRTPGSIEEEQQRNVTAQVHVVGLGVETRPDEMTLAEVVRFRRYGVTRVEMGVQHTDDALLKRVNRGHKTSHSRAAIKLLKDYGFKVEIHIMADLPGATPDGDKDCYRQVLRDDPDLIPDYLKDYPCLDVDFTRIKEWKASGKWQPYAERTPDATDLKDVLIYRQEITPKWVRVNRMQRDFQEAGTACLGYTSQSIKTNLAQIVTDAAEARGIYCQCIRCCELSGEAFDPADIVYRTEMFEASGGTEYFISAEVPRERRPILLGFIRLRLSGALHESVIPELRGSTAMIRELHVYGSLKAVGKDGLRGAQHMGIGRELLARAEDIARGGGYDKIAVISGIGVRGYYRKNGYELRGSYMMKSLKSVWDASSFIYLMILVWTVFLCWMIWTH